MANGVWAWAFSPSQYVQEAIKNMQNYIAGSLDKRWKLPKRVENPLALGYMPELDVLPVLPPDLASCHHVNPAP